MYVLTFTYDKNDGTEARKRFVSTAGVAGNYIEGIDLEDGSYKKFLVSRIKDDVLSWGNFAQVELDRAALLCRTDIYDVLNYDESVHGVLDLLTSGQLIDLCGQHARMAVQVEDQFLVFDPIKQFKVTSGENQFTIAVSDTGVYFYDERGKSLSESDFCSRVLSRGKV